MNTVLVNTFSTKKMSCQHCVCQKSPGLFGHPYWSHKTRDVLRAIVYKPWVGDDSKGRSKNTVRRQYVQADAFTLVNRKAVWFSPQSFALWISWWNSELDGRDLLYAHYETLQVVLRKRDWVFLLPGSRELIGDLHTLPRPFKDATEILSSSKEATLHKVVSITNKLWVHLNNPTVSEYPAIEHPRKHCWKGAKEKFCQPSHSQITREGDFHTYTRCLFVVLVAEPGGVSCSGNSIHKSMVATARRWKTTLAATRMANSRWCPRSEPTDREQAELAPDCLAANYPFVVRALTRPTQDLWSRVGCGGIWQNGIENTIRHSYGWNVCQILNVLIHSSATLCMFWWLGTFQICYRNDFRKPRHERHH